MTDAFQLFTDKFMDVLRITGIGNGTGFLAAIVAFTYFPQKPEMADFLKRLSLAYLYGLGFFILSGILFLLFLSGQTAIHGRTHYNPTFNSPVLSVALLLAGCSLVAWCYATVRVGIMIFNSLDKSGHTLAVSERGQVVGRFDRQAK
jgi:drug/metabolite transporter (DMT)-like permease